MPRVGIVRAPRYQGRINREWYWPRPEPSWPQRRLLADVRRDGRRLLLQLPPLAVAYRPAQVTVRANLFVAGTEGGVTLGGMAHVRFAGTVTLPTVHLGDQRYVAEIPRNDMRWAEVVSVGIFPMHAPLRTVECARPCSRCGCRRYEEFDCWDSETGDEWTVRRCARCKTQRLQG